MPTTIVIPTDAFRESRNFDFIESPAYDRGGNGASEGEAGIPITCTFIMVRSLAVGLTRDGWTFGGPGGWTARTALSSTLMRYTNYSQDAAGAWIQHVQQKYKDHRADTDTVTSSGTFDYGIPFPANAVTSNIVDSDVECSWRIDEYSELGDFLYYTTVKFHDPWTHAQFVAEAEAVWASKVSAWGASNYRSSEYWEYIGGSLVSGYNPLAGAAIIATAQGGSGYYQDVIWNLEITGGQYYFYMPSLLSGLLCQNKLTLLEYGSVCTFIGVGGAASSFVNAVNLGSEDGSTSPIAGSTGYTIATQLPSVNIYPYTFADMQYHQRAYRGNPMISI